MKVWLAVGEEVATRGDGADVTVKAGRRRDGDDATWCAGCKASSVGEDGVRMALTVGKNGLEKVTNSKRVLRAVCTNV